MRRAGRDGSDSEVILLFNSMLMRNVTEKIRSYIHNHNSCKRTVLMQAFRASAKRTEVYHKCCDICMIHCHCGIQSHPSSHALIATRSDTGHRPRIVSQTQQGYVSS